MKQHIKLDQLMNLKSEEIIKLLKNNHINSIFKDSNKKEATDIISKYQSNNPHPMLTDISLKCSIGNLIAILNDFGKFEVENLTTEKGTQYYVTITHPELNYFTFGSKELCDALWEAVKRSLMVS